MLRIACWSTIFEIKVRLNHGYQPRKTSHVSNDDELRSHSECLFRILNFHFRHLKIMSLVLVTCQMFIFDSCWLRISNRELCNVWKIKISLMRCLQKCLPPNEVMKKYFHPFFVNYEDVGIQSVLISNKVTSWSISLYLKYFIPGRKF